MSQSNQIEVRIPEADLAEIKAGIEMLRTKLLPHLQTLTSKERLEMPKMGDKTVAFVQKSYDYARTNGPLAPPYMDLEGMAVDMAAVRELHDMTRRLEPVMEALHDSLALSGSEAYQAALVFYNAVKAAAKTKASGAAAIYADLSTRFPSTTSRKRSDSTGAK